MTYKDFFFKVAVVFIKLSGIKEGTAENTEVATVVFYKTILLNRKDSVILQRMRLP